MQDPSCNVAEETTTSVLLPSLVPINDPLFKNIHFGPTDSSNWLIPDRLVMSAYPGDLDSKKAEEKIAQLLQAGINCFVNLQLKEELTRFTPYEPIIERYCTNNGIAPHDIEFLSLPIPDSFVTTDDIVMKFVSDEVIPRIMNSSKKILVHCFGGHGRTGTISAIALSHLYQLNAQDSLDRVSKAHACRKPPRGRAPQTNTQFEQVKRLAYGSTYNSDDNE